jgi:plastocyanin
VSVPIDARCGHAARAKSVIRRAAAAVVAGMRSRPQRLLAICAIAAAAGAGGQAAAASQASGRTVTLRDVAFSPKRLTVSRGATVTFRWRDGDTAHDVTSRGARRFASIGARESGSRSRTFTSAGTYRYVCTLHPGMAGRITVR